MNRPHDFLCWVRQHAQHLHRELNVHHITAPHSLSCKGNQRQVADEIIATLGAVA